jgi:glyoxylase-like metal-dependent hydrolase (beta-lactamase superfamily II)
MNMAFVVGTEAVAVIEPGYTEAMAEEMLRHIARVTSKPVRYAISSNSQPDRYFGVEVFRRRGAPHIASAPEARRMAEMGWLFAQAAESALKLPAGSVRPPRAPDRVIESETALDLGGVTLRLHPLPAAHTPGPLAVHIVEDNVVYAGDVLYRGRLLAVIEGGSVQSWIKAFDGLARFGDATFVPGHGRPGKLEAFRFSTRDYLVMLRDHMKKMVDGNIGVTSAIDRLDQSRFSGLANFAELARRNASIAYQEAEVESFR